MLLLHVILNELLVCFECPLKWCTCSTVWLLHGWCHMKLLPSQHVSAHIIQPCTSQSRHFMQSHIQRVHACFAITGHLHILAEQWDLLHTTVVTWWWNGYRSKSQHGKLTLESGALTTELSQLSHWGEIYFLLPLPCLCFI